MKEHLNSDGNGAYLSTFSSNIISCFLLSFQ